MVSIRPFVESDNTIMLEIEKLSPQGNEKFAMGVDRSPDITARYKIYDNWRVLIAEEEGKIVGWAGLILKQNPLQGDKYIYFVEVVVHPEFRKKGIATLLALELEKNVSETGADNIYCFISEQNDASNALVRKLGYSDMRKCIVCWRSAYKKANIEDKFTIERVDKRDIIEVVNLINDYYRECILFVPYTSESFESHLNEIPAYGLENFWVVKENGKIIACAGLWDYSSLARICIAKAPLMFEVKRGYIRFLSLFMKMPKIPAKAKYFKPCYITDHAFESKRPHAMSSLIAFFNNILLDNKRYFFGVALDQSDPMFEIIRQFKPRIDTFDVFIKALKGNLPNPSHFYLDFKDMVP
jgi:N-acetylglutamate synthase-like GNAT family acetyltransferase